MKNLITCLVVGMLCTTAPADNLVGTPSFESEGGPPSGHTWSVGPGSQIGEWLVTGDGVDYLGSGGSSNPGTPYGNQLVRLRSNYWQYDGSGGVTQSIEVSPGSAYLLSVWARGWTMTIPITLKGNDEEMQFGTTMEWAKYEVLLHPTVSPLNISIESEDSGANIIYAGPYIDNVELLLAGPNVWTVDDDGKADFDNIQAAIDAASDGDEIIVAPGTYTSYEDEVVDMRGKEIWLHSSAGAEVTIINGEGTRRGIYCHNGETNKTIIEGFTITNGNGIFGGGMYNLQSSPTLTNCTFENNTANYGGGMNNEPGSPTLNGCTFTNNTAGNGGGMYSSVSSSPTLENCTFENNSASNGGGMFNTQSSPTLDGCTFTGNTASGGGGGGGMYNTNSSSTLTDCTFENNTAGLSGGGGIYTNDGCPGCNITLTNCTFIGNTADGDGGGMYINSSNSPTLTNCTFTGNTGASGGGIHNRGVNPTLTNCTFENNTATTWGGGGMYNNDSSPTLTDCIFTNNNALDQGGGMCNYGSSSPTLDNCTFENNNAEFTGGGMWNDYSGSSPTLTNCTFTGNNAIGGGGGMYNSSSSPTLENCTFTFNYAYEGGGGMRNYFSSPTLTNCTFTGNTTEKFRGGGMYNYNSSPTLIDCIFTNNTAAEAGGGMYNYQYNSYPSLTNTTVCGNIPDQIYGNWTDNGGNTIADECPSCPDVNSDGIIDPNDIMAIIWAWGTCNGCSEDLNDDGVVGLTDLMIVIDSWDMECP